MIRNYLLIALRNLWRNKLITLINLLGMAIGFGIFLTFWSWADLDRSFDRFHEDIDQMYILNVEITMDEAEYAAERVGGIYGSALPERFPEVLSSCRVSQEMEHTLGVPAEEADADVPVHYFNEDEVLAVDTNFMTFFSFPLLEGDRESIFSERDHIVITPELADRLFGDQDAMGQSLLLGGQGYYRVAGIVEAPPEYSSFQFQALVGFHVLEELGYPMEEAGGNMYYTNLKLLEGTDVEALDASINAWVEQDFDLDVESRFFITPLTYIHLHGESRGIIGYIMNLVMAVVMLLIACINFLNLTTAYSTTRFKEIAIRKSMGAGRRQLMIQFLGETYILLLVSFYLGFIIAENMVPWLGSHFGVEHDMDLSGWSFWLQMLLLFIFTGLLAGLYPALRISGFNPLNFLGGKVLPVRHHGGRIRKVLMVTQFAFSVLFILLSVFLIRQYVHMNEADLGFNREDVVYVRTRGKVWEEYPAIKKDLSMLHFVRGVSTGHEVPVMFNSGDVDWGERDGDHNRMAVITTVSADFLSTFEIPLMSGSFFDEGKDSLNHEYVVVNRELVDVMGWDDPVGRKFYLWGNDYKILGVTESFHFFPFNLGIFEDRSLIMRYSPVNRYVFVRLRPSSGPEELAQMLEVFRTHNPGYELDYDYVSNFNLEMTDSAEGMRILLYLFSALAVMVAALGLIGLSVFHNNSRTKEVGIRKAMGARTDTITRLLLSDFIRLVIIANVIALPAAWLILNKILQFFSYRVQLKAEVFILVFIGSILASLLTVLYHALRTSRANPVRSLRYE